MTADDTAGGHLTDAEKADLLNAACRAHAGPATFVCRPCADAQDAVIERILAARAARSGQGETVAAVLAAADKRIRETPADKWGVRLYVGDNEAEQRGYFMGANQAIDFAGRVLLDLRTAASTEAVEADRGEWTGSCRTCAEAHPAAGCADVDCVHNCEAEVYAASTTAQDAEGGETVTEWGITIDDLGSTDMAESETEAREWLAAGQGLALVRVVVTEWPDLRAVLDRDTPNGGGE